MSNKTRRTEDALCAAIHKSYQNDPDKGDFISTEEAAAALEIDLDTLMDRLIDENIEALKELAK